MLKTIGDPYDIGEWIPTPTFLYRNRLYQKLIKGSQQKEFLDIGTGNGFLLKYLSENGFKGEAIDISKEALRLAQKFIRPGSGVSLRLADFYKISPIKKYDQIFCFEVLEHVPDGKRFIMKMPKLLKKNGRVLLSVPAHMSDWNKIDDMKGHLHRYEREELEKLFDDAGLKIIRFWSYGYPLLRILRKINETGKFIKQSNSKDTVHRTKESSIVQEYNPKFSFLVNQQLLEPAFLFMDLFLNTDKGFGFLVEAVN